MHVHLEAYRLTEGHMPLKAAARRVIARLLHRRSRRPLLLAGQRSHTSRAPAF